MHCTSADDRWSPLRVPIAPKACISSATCCGISPMRSIVYHQPIGLDIIKPKACILRPGIRAYARRFARSVSLRLGHARVLTSHRDVIHYAHAASLPGERAPRSPSGECAPTHLRERKCSAKTDPSQQKRHADGVPFLLCCVANLDVKPCVADLDAHGFCRGYNNPLAMVGVKSFRVLPDF